MASSIFMLSLYAANLFKSVPASRRKYWMTSSSAVNIALMHRNWILRAKVKVNVAVHYAEITVNPECTAGIRFIQL